ncbi:hypothetical protein HMPREF9078_01208 [Capnocytophaga sp. oral taxon 380 str. F0488]|nr:hypothetical protein HMPREF9078_01208 [Capnocytophaga sp. oral taxon 380 str. F0488]
MRSYIFIENTVRDGKTVFSHSVFNKPLKQALALSRGFCTFL